MAYIEDELVEQAISDFDDIKYAIINEGVDVPYGTDTKDYPKLINQAIQKNKDFVNAIQQQINVSDENLLMFKGNPNIKSLNCFDFSCIWNMQYLCDGCSGLVDIPSINAYYVSNADYAFNNCESLEKVELENTFSIESWAATFKNCQNLKSISTLDWTSATNVLDPFTDCVALEEIRFTPQTISVSYLELYSDVLSDESIASVLKGLNPNAEFGQLLVSSKTLSKLTDEQWNYISEVLVNWTIG